MNDNLYYPQQQQPSGFYNYEQQNTFHLPRPPRDISDEQEDLGIIKGLELSKDINEVILELQGRIYFFDPETKKMELVLETEPVMNALGIQNFVTCLKSVTKKAITFSNFDKEEVSPRIKAFCVRNFSHFIAHAEDFDLKEKDYNLIMNYLFNFSDGAYHKARGAGDRNVIRATYSEDLMMKQLGAQTGEMVNEKKGFFSKLFGGKNK